MITLAVIIFGLIIGSFLTVCIYRIPYGRPKGPPSFDEGEQDIVQPEEGAKDAAALTIASPPRSICPHCSKQLLWWHNIPLVSWILLRGKCGFCRADIPFRYPLVEILSVLAAMTAHCQWGLTASAAIIYAFACALIVISFIDIDYYIIPDVISLPGTVIGLALAACNQFYGFLVWPLAPSITSSLAGVIFGGGVLFAISEIYYRLRKREGLGMGDVKLLAMTGAFFGIEGALYTMFLGSMLGSVIGLLLIFLSGKTLSYQLPFGPYLALGTATYLFGFETLFGPRFPPLIG